VSKPLILSHVYDDGRPDFVEAHINLIDALRDYIDANDEIADDFLREGMLTPAQLRKWHAERQTLRLLLNGLEADTVDDGTLHELFKGMVL